MPITFPTKLQERNFPRARKRPSDSGKECFRKHLHLLKIIILLKQIQIANMVIHQGEKEPFIRNVFTLDTCAAIVGSQVKQISL